MEDLNRGSSKLKNEMDAIKRDVQETKEPHDPHMMGVVENSSNSLAQQSSDQATPSEDPDGMLHHREYRQLEPLYEAFICPLTRKIMRDPVSLENGVTYEKSAIDRWMQKCRNSGKEPTCFVTGYLITAPP